MSDGFLRQIFIIKNENFLGPVQLLVLYDEVLGKHL
jgi:hypothetical protein